MDATVGEVLSPSPKINGTPSTAQCANNTNSANPSSATIVDKCVSRTQKRKARREEQNNENRQKHPSEKIQTTKEEGEDVSRAHPTLSVRSKAARSKDFRDFLFETFAPLKAFAEAENARRADFQRRNNLEPLHGRLTEAMTLSKRGREGCTDAECSSSSSGAPTVAAAENESIEIACGAAHPDAAPTSATSKIVVAERPIDAPYVLDVAGGKGEVSVPLRIRGVGCGVVDPRTDRGSMRKLMKYVDKSLNAKATIAAAKYTATDAVNSAGNGIVEDEIKEDKATTSKTKEDAVKEGSEDVRDLMFRQVAERGELLVRVTSRRHNAKTVAPTPPVSSADTGTDRAAAAARAKQQRINRWAVVPVVEEVEEEVSWTEVLAEYAAATAAAVDGAATGPSDTSTFLSIRMPDVFCEMFFADDSADEDVAQGDADNSISKTDVKTNTSIGASEGLRAAKRRCDVVVGMHPDQATEPIVDFSLRHKKPFAIVPCCVFPKENPRRRLVMTGADNGGNEGAAVGIIDPANPCPTCGEAPHKRRADSISRAGSSGSVVATSGADTGASSPPCSSGDADTAATAVSVVVTLRPVESYDDYITYLSLKAAPCHWCGALPAACGGKPVTIKRATLPIEGRNTVLFVDGYA